MRTLLALPFLVRRLPAAGRNAVLLTFDDGPVAGVTEAVLERLAAHDVRALFCLVGRRVEAAPELARRIADAGHALGNHSHVHDMSPWPNPPAYLDDLERCNRIITRAAGRPPTAFRAPGGRLHQGSVLAPRRCGLRHVHWSVDPRDYACQDPADAAELGRRLAAELRGRDIVLLHDDRPTILPLLDELLPRLVARGFDLAAGPRLLRLGGGAP
ncbi:MAG: polysaccharide deacetylase family protein [Candidatus Krumholzibacteriia bacterium]